MLSCVRPSQLALLSYGPPMEKAYDVIWLVLRKLLQIASSAAWMPTSWWFWLLPLPFCVPVRVLVSPLP